MLYGSTASQGAVPVSSRSIINEVVFMMMRSLVLELEIRLTGLRTLAPHTSMAERASLIREMDPANPERWTARLDDGTVPVSVCGRLTSCTAVVGTTSADRRE